MGAGAAAAAAVAVVTGAVPGMAAQGLCLDPQQLKTRQLK